MTSVRRRSRSTSSESRRDFPTPAGPNSVTSCGARSRSTRAATAVRTASSSSRPTSGAVRPATPRGAAAGSSVAAERPPRQPGRPLALRLDVLVLAIGDRAARRRLRALPDEHLAGLRVLLKARRDVDRIAADHQLAARRRFPAGDDLAGVDPDPEPDVRAVAALDALGEGAEALPHGERSPNGALRVVLVRLRDAEDGEHGVAGELLRRAPEALDLGVDQVEELTLKLANVLGIEPLAERSRPSEVGEQNGDDPPLLPLVSSVGARRASSRRAMPQEEQKAAAGRLLKPAQRDKPAEAATPQSLQKRAPAGVLGAAGAQTNATRRV